MSDNKSLPASPRLEQLRRQGKELHKALKSGVVQAAHRIRQQTPKLAHHEPDAILSLPLKLADVQFVLAREYGFASWARLKAHVTSLTQPSQTVLEQFKAAVRARDASALRQLLQSHAPLAAVLDDPFFDFDAPAVVVCKNDRAMVDVLLEFGADINARSRWWAGSFGVLDNTNPEMAAYLIERGAIVDVHAAAGLGMFDRLRDMIAADPEKVHALGGDGQRPLHFATDPAVIDFLLEHGAEIDARDLDHHATAAQWAINEEEKLRHLLRRGARADIYMACALGDVDLAKRILEEDPGVLDTRLGEGQFTAPGEHIYIYKLGYTATPLSLAAQRGHGELVDFLLQGSTVRERLLFACRQADEAAVRAMLAEHPGIVRELPEREKSVICASAWDGDAAAVGVMLRAGFDVDVLGVGNATPLNRAACWGYLEVVELCLTYGASLTIVNDYGGNPLGACLYGSLNLVNERSLHAACVERLLAAGSALPPKAWGSPECIEVLRRHGASVQ